MKRQRFTLLLLLVLPLLGLLAIPVGHTWLKNLWGVTSGNSQVYRISQEVAGSVEGVMSEYYLQYSVLSVTDLDADNHTDVSLRLVDFSTDPITMTDFTVPDTDTFALGDMNTNYVNDIIMDGVTDTLTFYLYLSIPTLSGYQLLLPITSNSTFGLDWTAALTTINGSGGIYADYTGYDQGDRALITYNSTGFDATLQANYDLLGTIIWDRTTGWLISLEYAQIYDDPFGFTLYHSIEPSSLPSTILGAEVIRDIFAWLGLAIAIAGLCFAYYIHKKMRQNDKEKDLE